MSKVLYYLPVDEKYLDQWEYYKVDKEMLKESYKNLYVCSSIISFLKNILKVNYGRCSGGGIDLCQLY